MCDVAVGEDDLVDGGIAAETLEIRFIEEAPERTRVELEHRHLDRYGAQRDQMRRIFDSEGDWGRVLAGFAQLAATEAKNG